MLEKCIWHNPGFEIYLWVHLEVVKEVEQQWVSKHAVKVGINVTYFNKTMLEKAVQLYSNKNQ